MRFDHSFGAPSRDLAQLPAHMNCMACTSVLSILVPYVCVLCHMYSVGMYVLCHMYSVRTYVCTMPYVQCGHVRLNTTFHKMGRVSSALERCLNSQWTKFVSKLTPTPASIHSLFPPSLPLSPPLSPFCVSCHSFVWVLQVFLVRTAAVTHVSCS